MIAYMRALLRYGKDDSGASAVEYGLLVAAIAAVIVAVVFGLGALVRDALNSTGDCLTSNGTSSSCPTNT